MTFLLRCKFFSFLLFANWQKYKTVNVFALYGNIRTVIKEMEPRISKINKRISGYFEFFKHCVVTFSRLKKMWQSCRTTIRLRLYYHYDVKKGENIPTYHTALTGGHLQV